MRSSWQLWIGGRWIGIRGVGVGWSWREGYQRRRRNRYGWESSLFAWRDQKNDRRSQRHADNGQVSFCQENFFLDGKDRELKCLSKGHYLAAAIHIGRELAGFLAIVDMCLFTLFDF